MSLSAYLCEEVYESEEEYEESYTVSKKQVTSRSICCVFSGDVDMATKSVCGARKFNFRSLLLVKSYPRLSAQTALATHVGEMACPIPHKGLFRNQSRLSMSQVAAVKPEQRATNIPINSYKKPQSHRNKSVRQVDDKAAEAHEHID